MHEFGPEEHDIAEHVRILREQRDAAIAMVPFWRKERLRTLMTKIVLSRRPHRTGWTNPVKR